VFRASTSEFYPPTILCSLVYILVFVVERMSFRREEIFSPTELKCFRVSDPVSTLLGGFGCKLRLSVDFHTISVFEFQTSVCEHILFNFSLSCDPFEFSQ